MQSMESGSKETGSFVQSEEREEKQFDIKRLLTKLHQIIQSKKSFEEKVLESIKVIFEECKVFVTNLFSQVKLFENIMTIINNCYG